MHISTQIYVLPHACTHIGKSRAIKQNKQGKIKLKDEDTYRKHWGRDHECRVKESMKEDGYIWKSWGVVPSKLYSSGII